MSTVGRVLLAVVGVIVAFAGVVAWSLEDEYGSGLNFSLSGGSVGNWVVSELDEHSGTAVIRFEGSYDEATTYTEARRSAEENFLVPGLVIAGGALMIAVAAGWPLLRRFHRRDGTV